MQRREEEYWCQSHFPTEIIHLFFRFRFWFRFRFRVCVFSIRPFQLISHTVNIFFTILFAQFFDKLYQSKVQWLSHHIGYISVQALHFRLVSCEGARLDCWIFVFPAILLFQKNFTDHFVTACVDFGIAFSIKFLSSSAFLGLRKGLEQDTMSSLVSRTKVQNTCEVWFSCILIYT